MTVYGERDYRAAKAVLALGGHRCWYGCGRLADTPDHWPPLAEHHHTPGANCCQLRPACRTCNTSAGATVGNRRRRRRRLAPGSGWS